MQARSRAAAECYALLGSVNRDCCALLWRKRSPICHHAVVAGNDGRSASRELLIAALEAAPTAMLIVEHDGRIVFSNSEVSRLFGYSRAETQNMNVDALVPDEVRKRHASFRALYQQSPTRRSMGKFPDRILGRHADGRSIPLEVALNPIDLDGQRITIVGIVDRTGQVHAQEARKKRERDLQAQVQSLTQFAYAASHDLQEPLRKVSLFCELLAEEAGENLSPNSRQYVHFIVDGARRMQVLVSDLLEYSRTASLTEPLRPVHSRTALRAALDTLSDAIGQAEVEVDAVGDLPEVQAHPTLLDKVFVNLLSNAIKYRDPSRRCRIQVKASHRDGVWEFSVEDNGIGIEASQHERVFQAFQRLHSRDQFPGTGLGLAIVRRAVERCDGSVWLKSEPGVGTTVLFTLNDASAHPAQSQKVTEASKTIATSTGTTTSATPPTEGQSIAVLDDDPFELRLLERCCKRSGFSHELVTFSDPVALMRWLSDALARGTPPSHVLIDLRMPQTSGFSVVEAIQQAHPVPPPMSLLTASPDPRDVERAKGLGVALLPKPDDVDATVDLLSACVDTG